MKRTFQNQTHFHYYLHYGSHTRKMLVAPHKVVNFCLRMVVLVGMAVLVDKVVTSWKNQRKEVRVDMVVISFHLLHLHQHQQHHHHYHQQRLEFLDKVVIHEVERKSLEQVVVVVEKEVQFLVP